MTNPTPIPTPPIHSTTPGTWQAWLSAALGLAVGVIDLFHPGWTQPTAVTAVVPAASFLAAAAVSIFDFVTKRKVALAKTGAA